MQIADIRNALHQYIDKSDDIIIKLMFALAKEYDDNNDYTFSEAEIRIFDERRRSRLSGKSRVYNWQDAKNIIIENGSKNEV